MSAKIEEAAILDGERTVCTKMESRSFKVNVVDTADVPSVYADDVSGQCLIPIDLGRERMDADVALGRDQSESLYFIVSTINAASLAGYRLMQLWDSTAVTELGSCGVMTVASSSRRSDHSTRKASSKSVSSNPFGSFSSNGTNKTDSMFGMQGSFS